MNRTASFLLSLAILLGTMGSLLAHAAMTRAALSCGVPAGQTCTTDTECECLHGADE